MNTKQEADKLRAEAKRLLSAMLGLPENIASEQVDRFVDCVISAAMLEIVDTMNRASDRQK